MKTTGAAIAVAALFVLAGCEVKTDANLSDAAAEGVAAIENGAEAAGEGIEAAAEDAGNTLEKAGDTIGAQADKLGNGNGIDIDVGLKRDGNETANAH